MIFPSTLCRTSLHWHLNGMLFAATLLGTFLTVQSSSINVNGTNVLCPTCEGTKCTKKISHYGLQKSLSFWRSMVCKNKCNDCQQTGRVQGGADGCYEPGKPGRRNKNGALYVNSDKHCYIEYTQHSNEWALYTGYCSARFDEHYNEADEYHVYPLDCRNNNCQWIGTYNTYAGTYTCALHPVARGQFRGQKVPFLTFGWIFHGSHCKDWNSCHGGSACATTKHTAKFSKEEAPTRQMSQILKASQAWVDFVNTN